MEVPPARPGSGVVQNQLTRRQKGDKIPVEGHQAFAAGQPGGGDPAIGDGIAHQRVLQAELLQQGPLAAERQQLHAIGAEQGRQKCLGSSQWRGLAHHRQQAQAITPGGSGKGSFHPIHCAAVVRMVGTGGCHQHVHIGGHAGTNPSAASSRARLLRGAATAGASPPRP